MCLIIYQPPESSFDIGLTAQIRLHNPDGIGFMWIRDGRVRHKKGMWSVIQTEKEWKKIESRPLAIHFRSATKGHISLENVQPFKILSIDENDPYDLFMMHNGTLTSVPIENQAKSDTYYYANNFLTPILRKNPALLDSEEFQNFLGASIGQNKLLFLRANAEINDAIIINESLGKKLENGSWVSNQYSLKPKKPGANGVTYNTPGSRWDAQTQRYVIDNKDPKFEEYY